MTARLYLLYHTVAGGPTLSTPGGFHAPFYAKGFDACYRHGLYGVPGERPLDTKIALCYTLGLAGIQFSWHCGAWAAPQSPVVGLYPTDRGPIPCAVRTPVDIPPEALAAGHREATTARIRALREMGKEAWLYTGLPRHSMSITTARIAANYQAALDYSYTGIEVDVAGGCAAMIDGKPTSAYKCVRWLTDRFADVSLEPTDLVTPALLDYYTGQFSTCLANDWRERMYGAGWAGLNCPGIFKRRRIVLTGSVPVERRVKDAGDALGAGIDVVLEDGGITDEQLCSLL